MSLSTSNSEPFWPKPLILLVCIASIGFIKGFVLDDYYAEFWNEKSFWAARVHDEQKYNIVFIGDSRTYRSINVNALQDGNPTLSDLNIANKGFSAAGLRSDYMRWAAGLLETNGPHVLVLGVTTASLSTNPAAKLNQHFTESNRSTAYRIFLFLEKLFNRDTTYAAFRGQTPARYAPPDIYHPGGWVEAKLEAQPISDDSTGAALRKIVIDRDEVIRKLGDNPISEADIQDFIRCIGEFENAGLRVVAFRPPTDPLMEQLEDLHGTLDFNELRQRLSDFGVEWISIPDRQSYESYDGSHLTPGSASKLSRVLGRSLEALLQEPSDLPSKSSLP